MFTDLLTKLNWVDLFAIILIARITYVGSLLGVGKQILPSLSICFTLMVALYYYSAIGDVIVAKSSIAKSVSDFFVFLFIILIIGGIKRLVEKYVPLKLPEGLIPFERTIGSILGLLRSLIVMGLVVILLFLAPIGRLTVPVKDSFSAMAILKLDLSIYAEAINAIKGYKDFDRLTAAAVFAKISAEKDYQIKLFDFDLKGKGKFYKKDES